MKRAVSVICAALLLVSLLSFAACSNSKTADQSIEGDDISGTYRLTEIVLEGKTYAPSELGYSNVSLEISGNKATMKGFDTSETAMDIDAENMEFKSGDHSFPYMIDGKKLKIKMEDDLEMIFEKQ